jgi:hypothetical protein
MRPVRILPGPKQVAFAVVLTAMTLLAGGADAAMRVRVTAVTHIEARVYRAAAPKAAVVRGTLRDDVGNPIGSSHVAIDFFEGDGKGPPILLPVPSRCPDDVSPEAHVAPDEYVVDTDGAGRFCFEAVLGIERGKMRLQFAGDHDHEPASADVPIDLGRPAVTMAFDPEPKVLSLDRPSFVATLRVIAPALAKQGWRVTLRDERGEVLGAGNVEADGSARIEVPTRALQGPGPGELRASLEGAPVFAAPIAAPIERRAHVEVLVEGANASGVPEEGIPLLVRARWARGAVPSGSIEVRLGELSVGMAALRNGEARVTATFAAVRTATLTLRAGYVPAAPWWEAGAPAPISVTIRQGTPWRRMALSALALALLAWVLREAYDFRPLVRRRRRGAAAVPPAGAVLAPALVRGRPSSTGWLASVVDAHDGTPIEGASFAVVLPVFPSAEEPAGQEVLARGTADAAGRFILGEGPFPRGALLQVSSAGHAHVEMPLPPPSELSIAMVSRRRRLLDRLVAFAGREWGDEARRELTPDQVVRKVRRAAEPPASAGRSRQIEAFARATESAAFGPTDVDEPTEATVLALEPRS